MGPLKKLHPSHLFTSIILIASAISNPGDALEPPRQPKFSVHRRVDAKVWNGIPEELAILTKCKSKDDDLGLKSVLNGTAYSWSFHPNWAGTTLFSCQVALEGHRSVGFNAYDFRRDYDAARCVSECTWNATSDGVHGFNEGTRSYDLFYPWRRYKS